MKTTDKTFCGITEKRCIIFAHAAFYLFPRVVSMINQHQYGPDGRLSDGSSLNLGGYGARPLQQIIINQPSTPKEATHPRHQIKTSPTLTALVEDFFYGSKFVQF